MTSFSFVFLVPCSPWLIHCKGLRGGWGRAVSATFLTLGFRKCHLLSDDDYRWLYEQAGDSSTWFSRCCRVMSVWWYMSQSPPEKQNQLDMYRSIERDLL